MGSVFPETLILRRSPVNRNVCRAADLGRKESPDPNPRVARGLPQDWGSGCDGHWRVLVVGGLEALPEAGAERAVVDGAADLEQPIGAAPGPAHLLRFGHPAVHQEVGRALGQRRADPLPRPMSLGIVDQPVALAGE